MQDSWFLSTKRGRLAGRRCALVLSATLFVAACGGSESAETSATEAAEASGDSASGAGGDVSSRLADGATVVTCGFDEEFGFVVADVELANPLDEPTQNIFVYVEVSDPAGEMLESITAMFVDLEVGATATETAFASLTDPAVAVSCEVTGGAVS